MAQYQDSRVAIDVVPDNPFDEEKVNAWMGMEIKKIISEVSPFDS